MIKINLCPLEELESPYWYVPDVLTLVFVAATAYLGVQHYLGTIQEQIDVLAAETDQKQAATEALKPQIAQFADLDRDIKELKTKLASLKSITVSKIARYKPVIVMEHLQNLKPEGVWFQSFKVGLPEGPNAFELNGQAFDNLLVAEMMMAMKSTAFQDKDQADLRTHIHFDDVQIKATTISETGTDLFPEMRGFPVFQLTGSFAELSVGSPDQAAPGVGPSPSRGAVPASPAVSLGPDNADAEVF